MAGLSKSLVEVGISMVLKDGFSQQAGRISGSYQQMINDMGQWNRAMTQSAGNAFDYGIRALNAMTDAYQHYASISGEMFMVGKIAGASAQQQKDLLDLTRQVNLETPLTNADIVSGERYLAMAGNNAEKIQAMIRPASQLASIFQMQLGGKGGVADLMTNIMATFNIAASDAQKTSDILYTATTNANINLTDLAQSLQYSGAAFRNAGIDLATASAAIGILGDQGIQASSAGTALANMIRYLNLSITGQKTKGTQMLEAMGITRDDLVDAEDNLKDLGTLMGVLASKMKDLGGVSKGEAMYNIFGIRGEKAASAFLNALWVGSNKMADIIQKSNQSLGVTNEVMAEWLQTDQGAILRLTSAMDNLKMSIGHLNSTLFTPIVRSITRISTWVERIVSNDRGIGKWVIYLGNAVVISTILVNGLRLIHGVIKIVNYQVAAINGNTQASVGGMMGMNTQAKILIGHLQIIALMLARINMGTRTAGRYSLIPGGALRVGKKGGDVAFFRSGSRWRQQVSPEAASRYMRIYGRVPMGAAVGATAGVAAKNTSRNVARMGFGAALKGVGGGIVGFLGGPWGIALTAALTVLPSILNKVSNKMDANSLALQDNTDAISSQEILSGYIENYTRAIREAVEAASGKSNTINITINGRPVGNFKDGDSVPLDEYGFDYR